MCYSEIHVDNNNDTNSTRSQRKNETKPSKMERRSKKLHRGKNQTTRTLKNTSRNRTKSRKTTNKNRLNKTHQGGQRTPKLVLDSSILVKLVTNEPNSKQARTTITALIKKGYALYTVDIALAESLNAIWKHTKIQKDLKPEETKPITQDLIKIYDKLNIITTRELTEEATNIALAQNITIYDALYIAGTQKLNAILYTADQKLHNIANKITHSKLLKTLKKESFPC